MEEARHNIAQHELGMPAKGAVEGIDAGTPVLVLGRLHFPQQIGMRAQHALGKGHQRAGEDIGPSTVMATGSA